MKDVVERLRKSKERVENADIAGGHHAGREWASSKAEFDELQRVAAFHAGIPDYGVAQWDAPFGAGGWFYAAVVGEGRPDGRDVNAFWERITGDSTVPSEAFVSGFAEGAADVWDEVEGELEWVSRRVPGARLLPSRDASEEL